MRWEYGYVTSGSHPNYGTAVNLFWLIAGGQTQTIVSTQIDGYQEQATKHGKAVNDERLLLIARLGLEGWEMVGFEGWTYFFKRPIAG